MRLMKQTVPSGSEASPKATLLSEKQRRLIAAGRDEFRQATPFPHVIVDGLIDETILREAARAFPPPESGSWITYTHFNERKLGRSARQEIPEPIGAIIDVLNDDAFVRALSDLTGLSLIADPELSGGGLHQTEPGGFLNVHVDFQAHPYRPSLRRRLNVILFLNEDWQEAWGGHLELWSERPRECVVRVAPVFNRCVIFSTEPGSLHGHPDKLRSPQGVTRKSIALYYFTEDDEVRDTPTLYYPRPEDGALERLKISVGQLALHVYGFLRRRFGLDHATVGRWLRKIFP